MKKFTKSIFILWILIYNPLFGQTSIFNISGITGTAGLNSEQLSKYNVLLASGSYTSINFINTGDLLTLADSGELNIHLPFIINENIVLKVENCNYTNDSNYTWVGSFMADSLSTESYQYAKLTMMKNKGLFIGHFTFDDKSYEYIDLTGGIQAFCESKMLAAGGTGCSDSIPTGHEEIIGSKPGDNPCKNFTTRVLFLYTDQTLQAFSDINGVATLGLQQLNDIWFNSQIYNKLYLAGIEKITFNQNVTNPPLNEVGSLSNNTYVQALRVQYKADIVVLLVKDLYILTDGTIVHGVAKENNANFAGAYCIVQVNSATSGRFTFAHEVSHLYGARHDIANDNTPGSAHGFIFFTGCNWLGNHCVERKTLMTLLVGNESRIDRVSNPNLTFLSVPTGSSNADNASEISNSLEFVANFYPDAIPKYGWIKGHKISCFSATYNITICDDPELFNYQWYESVNGLNWTPTGANIPLLVHTGYKFIKCVVTLKTVPFPMIYTFQVPPIAGCLGSVNGIEFPRKNLATGPIEAETENQYGRAISQASLSGINMNESITSNIYPNPNKGDFTLEFNSEEKTNLKITIFDYTGKELEIINAAETVKGFNQLNIKTLTKLNKGLYVIKVLGLQKPLVKTFVID